jgi:choline dehydrogenase-like flavoprotein
MVELQIGGVATPEWVWQSRSPAKHALNRLHRMLTKVTAWARGNVDRLLHQFTSCSAGASFVASTVMPQ